MRNWVNTKVILMRLPGLLLALALLPVLGAMPLTSALAQSGDQQQPASSEENFSEDELKSYATASLQVERITQQYLPMVKNAESVAQTQALQRRAKNEMHAALIQAGLSVEKYNAIAMAVRSNPAVADKVQSYMANPSR